MVQPLAGRWMPVENRQFAECNWGLLLLGLLAYGDARRLRNE